MELLAIDTETALIAPGLQAPPISCVTWAAAEGEGILHVSVSKDLVEEALRDKDIMLVGHNIAYDMLCIMSEWPELLPEVFQAYDDDRIFDTMIAEKLLDIGAGCYRYLRLKDVTLKRGYSLADVARRYLKKDLDKDTWRLKYGELRDVPMVDWPEGAIQYAVEDARVTFDVQAAQAARNERISASEFLVDLPRQCRSALWLKLTSAWGIHTYGDKIEELKVRTEQEYERLKDFLLEKGLVRVDGSRDTKKAKQLMIKAMGGEDNCEKTDKGGVKLDEDACKASGEPILEAYAEFGSFKTVMSKDLPMLEGGKEAPIHTRFEELLETGRTSSSSPNIQNIRRFPGIRECFVPRAGMVFVDADYSGLELHCLAQVCIELLGWSRLGDSLNAGKDPHSQVAATILCISYEEAILRKKAGDPLFDDARQTGKVANFGFPGGLGISSLVDFARKTYNVKITEEDARQLKAYWFETFPEMREYFRIIGSGIDDDENIGIWQVFSKRFRGRCRYTQACNTLFQGLGADATKAAGWLIAKACYLDKNSVLYGSRICNYVHDQFILESPEELGHECAEELVKLMVAGALPWLPDVPPRVGDPILSRFWSKKAKPVYDARGRLIPWS
jgi:DNA polymerase I-like protein with 3'-5' exonuclease and polymerase domains